MVTIELADDSKASFTSCVQKELLRQGYIIAQRPGLNVLRIDPSLTIESNNIEDFLDIFKYLLKS